MHGTGGAIKDIKISKKHDKGHQLMNSHSGFKVESQDRSSFWSPIYGNHGL